MKKQGSTGYLMYMLVSMIIIEKKLISQVGRGASLRMCEKGDSQETGWMKGVFWAQVAAGVCESLRRG